MKPGWKMGTDLDRLAIVDAHQHFWDLSLGKHPWLRDEPPPPFRYGDTRALRRSYLPTDYRADAAAYRIVGTVYVETQWAHDLAAREGLPSAVIAQAWLNRNDVEDVLARQACAITALGSPSRAARS